MKPESGGYSNKDMFKNNPDDLAFARFLYIHHVLRFKLAENNIAGIGGLWHRLPADSRFPDHTIWQHNALTAALCSCMELAKDERQVGILAFSITPVQPFIAKARKLRDYWTGSVLLSWLAFEGLRWVMEHLGPDHLLYPSLIDQPLVNEYLRTKWEMDDIASLCRSRDIASLPNKFLCLIPFNQAEAIADGVQQFIREQWRHLCDNVLEKIVTVTREEKGHLSTMFNRQTDNFWDMQWSAAKLLEKTDIGDAKNLLFEGALDEPVDVFECFSRLVRDKWHYEMDARGLLYSGTHQLVQTALAVQKTRKKITRPVEPGQKCHLCAEFEVLHAKPYSGDSAAHDYKAHIDDFWKGLAQAWGAKTDLDGKGKEKLCALCLTKRIAYRVLKDNKDHILHTCFDDAGSFPSATQMALHEEFKRKGITEKRKSKNVLSGFMKMKKTRKWTTGTATTLFW